MTNKVFLTFCCFSLLLLSGCSKKSISGLSSTQENYANIEEVSFDYFQGKARMVYQDGLKEREVKANIRIRKDSVIWLNFTVIGLQGGRALINHDSITIINQVEKEYYVFDYKELSRQFNFEINYDVIQSAFLGNLIMPRKTDDVSTVQDASVVLKQKLGSVDVLNYINSSTKKVEKISLKEFNTNNSLSIDYSNFQLVGDKLFPYNGVISLLYTTPKGLLNTTIIIEYTKAEVADKELKFPFTIRKKYDGR